MKAVRPSQGWLQKQQDIEERSARLSRVRQEEILFTGYDEHPAAGCIVTLSSGLVVAAWQ